MFTPNQLAMYAAIGSVVAMVIMRAEDKFNNKQYSRGQYLQAAVAGFIITLIPIWLLSRSATTMIGGDAIRVPTATKPMSAPVAPPSSMSSESSFIPQLGGGSRGADNGSGNSGAFFTPIMNSMKPKMQYRTSGPTF